MKSYLVSDHEFVNPKMPTQFLSKECFLEAAYSDDGLTCDALYVDANIIDRELYDQLQDTDFNIVYVRDQKEFPAFVTQPIENWGPERPSARERLAQANGLLHRFVLDKSLGFSIGFFVLAIVANLVLSANYRMFPDVVMAFLFAACLIFLVYATTALTLRILYGVAAKIGGRCGKCQKWFAIKKARKEVIGTDAISIKKTLEQKNKHGELISTSEQYIPGTRTFYRQWYLCTKCGHESYKDFFRDTENV